MRDKPTTLVLLPGLDGTEVFFRPLLASLPAWIRPIVVTYPTTGGNDYAALLPAVRKAVADAGEFHVLGWSFSGPLALMLAAAESERTRGVILCSTFVRAPHPVLPWLRFAAVGPVVGFLRAARRLPEFALRIGTDEFRHDKRATWDRVPARVLAARTRALLRVDARPQLRACQHRVLYLAGSRDLVVPRRNAREVMRELPAARVETIPGRHLALYSNPAKAVERIVAFIEGA